MAILVVCPGCRARFQVSDQYAGKSGACPKCKATIKVPAAGEEVKIHAPEEFGGGGKNAAGQIVLKPIARTENTLGSGRIAAIVAGVILVLVLDWLAAGVIRDNILVRGIGLLLIAPPLAVASYFALRNDELEPHRGKVLYLRVAICSVAYVALWGIYLILTHYHPMDIGILIYVAPLVLVGALSAMGCFDLDFGNGCLHYSFFLLVSILLARIADGVWLWHALM